MLFKHLFLKPWKGLDFPEMGPWTIYFHFNRRFLSGIDRTMSQPMLTVLLFSCTFLPGDHKNVFFLLSCINLLFSNLLLETENVQNVGFIRKVNMSSLFYVQKFISLYQTLNR